MEDPVVLEANYIRLAEPKDTIILFAEYGIEQLLVRLFSKSVHSRLVVLISPFLAPLVFLCAFA